MTADECWRHCCCYSLEEKIAWAANNGVVPPDELLDEWRNKANRASLADVSGGEPNATATKSGKSVCACCVEHVKSQAVNRPDPCHETRAECNTAVACCELPADASDHSDTDSNTARTKFVIGFEARKCKGLTGAWTIFAQCVMPPERVATPVGDTVVYLAQPRPASFPSISLEPPSPPPRRS